MAQANIAAPRSREWRERFRSQFTKTKLCRFYATGHCPYAQSCSFAHCTTDIGEAPDLSKTSICSKWMDGTCENAPDKCPYAHGDEELRRTPAFINRLPGKGSRSGQGAAQRLQKTSESGVSSRSSTNSTPPSSEDSEDGHAPEAIQGPPADEQLDGSPPQNPEQQAIESQVVPQRRRFRGHKKGQQNGKQKDRLRKVQERGSPLSDSAHDPPLQTLLLAEALQIPSHMPALVPVCVSQTLPTTWSASFYDCDVKDIEKVLLSAMPTVYED